MQPAVTQLAERASTVLTTTLWWRADPARAALNDGFEVVIVYGELGNTDISLNLLEDEGFKIRYIPKLALEQATNSSFFILISHQE